MIALRGVLVGLVLALVGCGTPTDRRWQTGDGYRWRALVDAGSGSAGFTQIDASASRIVHRNDVADEAALANRHLLLGAGVAIGDVDGDDRADLVFATTAGVVHLYHNQGRLVFADITAAAGLRGFDAPATGVVLADVDGDGDRDLLVGTLAGPLALWRNDGRGHFTDATSESGLPGGSAVTSLTLADVDGDGDLDLYAATYKRRTALDAYSPQDRAFDQVVKRVGGRYVVQAQWQAEYRVEDRPDLGGVVRSQRAEPDLFLLNDGAGHFTALPMAGERFRDEQGAPLASPPDFFTLAARFYDVTGDGAPDLYVCNDFEDPDQFWRNDGTGGFQLFPATALRATSNTCMSVEFGDIDRDGAVDLFTADMLAPTRAMRQRHVPTHTPLPKTIGEPRDRPQWMRNMLHRGRGDGTWSEIGEQAGVGATDWTWGSLFLDVDLDGYEDLLAANGHRWDIREADVYDAIRDRFPRVPWNREQGEFPPDTAHLVALRNLGDLTFEEVHTRWRIGERAGVQHAIASGDLDDDGDLDVVVTRLNDVPLLYRNDAVAGRVLVTLDGSGANRDGIGAKVTVEAAGIPAQSREMTSGGLYLAGAAPQLTFATGDAQRVRITVRWRDGSESRFEDVAAGREYRIDVRSGRRVADAGTDSVALFEDATVLLGGAAHRDSLFDDFARQPLLPARLSQLGPGVTWADLDGDGREEIVLGGGRGGATQLMTWRNERYVVAQSWAAPDDATTVLPVVHGEHMALLHGQSSYEQPGVDAVLLRHPEHGAGGPETKGNVVVGSDSASIGPLAMADVNGDGQLDLFVGARVRPGAWPLPAPSQLLLRTASGGWTRDTNNDATLRVLGLVSAAIFTDIDGDNDADLVAVGEFGPVRILRNTRGRFDDATAALGLRHLSSRWNGVASGDFNGDGRLDLVVTSYGTNTSWQASAARPHALYVGTFGTSGPGIVFARADADNDVDYPLEPLPRLALAMPDVRDRFATFRDFSIASVDQVLGGNASSAIRVGATTYAHLLLLNRGDRFEVRPLPTAAQLAPAFGVVVADFNGDANEDLFLAQNFSPTSIEVPRLVAGQGLVLLGDGRGDFRALSVRTSGITSLSDQRGAATADYDGDARGDLLLAQHSAPLRLWRNRGAQPGVRVQLAGDVSNPYGVGARVSVVRADGTEGPVREIAAGSGYWSMSSPTLVLARPADARAVRVRWPGGRSTDSPLTDALTYRIPHP
jgi:enediyne biosynthesis protein E4